MVHANWVLLAELRLLKRLVAMMLVLIVAMSPILRTNVIRRYSESALIHVISAHVLVVHILIVASLVHLGRLRHLIGGRLTLLPIIWHTLSCLVFRGCCHCLHVVVIC